MKHYTTKELLEVNDKAPLPVQEALSAETTITTITNLGTNLKLHIDQIGLIAELNVQMLLGLVNPQEFLNELIAAKVPEKDARAIMTEINQKIFVPLREQMRQGPAVAAESVKTAAPSAAPRSPAPKVEPPVAPQKFFHLENKIAAPATPRPPLQPAPGAASRPVTPVLVPAGKRASLREALSAVTLEKRGALPEKPLESNRLLEDHGEPHIEFNTTPTPPPPPVNLPGALPPVAVPQAAPPTPPVQPKAAPQVPPPPPKPVPQTPPPSAPAKPYSVDPYREPIEP